MDSWIKFKIFGICKIQQRDACLSTKKKGTKGFSSIKSIYRDSNSRSMSKPSPKNDQTSQRFRRHNIEFRKKIIKFFHYSLLDFIEYWDLEWNSLEEGESWIELIFRHENRNRNVIFPIWRKRLMGNFRLINMDRKTNRVTHGLLSSITNYIVYFLIFW